MKKRRPSSLQGYLKGVRGVLPPRSVSASRLGDLRICCPSEAMPARNESLSSWLDMARKNEKGKVPLTLVLGESSSGYRKARGATRISSPSRLLNMAYTCDGAAGARAVIGLIQNSQISLEDVDFNALIDEWCLKDATNADGIRNSHLIVLGTPEVNIFAVFLHGLVHDFHYGRDPWPPDLSSTGDKLYAGNREHLRCPRGNEISHFGGVFLLRNPWNPAYRVLWIGGLTGQGTYNGSSLVASGWHKYKDMAGISIGLVFGHNILGGDKSSRPRDWLVWSRGEPAWESTLTWSPPPPLPTPEVVSDHAGMNRHVFLSYCHENSEQATKLYQALSHKGVKV